MQKFNRQGGLTAVATGESDDKEINKGIHGGKYDIVFFFTPESLVNSKRWREGITRNIHVYGRRLKGLVVDEAHCVSKW